MPARRVGLTRGRAAALVVALAGLTVLSALPTWLLATASTPLRGEVTVVISGAQAAPAVVAAGVALLAASAALALVGRLGRWVVAVVVAGCGVLVVAAAVTVLANPTAAAVPLVAEQTGVGRLTSAVDVRPWPWLAVAVGVVDVLAAAWFLQASRAWAISSRRHEAPAARPGTVTPDDRSAWDALSRGDDPS